MKNVCPPRSGPERRRALKVQGEVAAAIPEDAGCEVDQVGADGGAARPGVAGGGEEPTARVRLGLRGQAERTAAVDDRDRRGGRPLQPRAPAPSALLRSSAHDPYEMAQIKSCGGWATLRQLSSIQGPPTLPHSSFGTPNPTSAGGLRQPVLGQDVGPRTCSFDGAIMLDEGTELREGRAGTRHPPAHLLLHSSGRNQER